MKTPLEIKPELSPGERWLEKAMENELTDLYREIGAAEGRLRAELQAGLSGLRMEMGNGLAAVRSEMRSSVAALQMELQSGFREQRKPHTEPLASGRLEALEGRMGTMEGRMATVEGQLGTLQQDLSEVRTVLYTLVERFDRMDARLDALEAAQVN